MMCALSIVCIYMRSLFAIVTYPLRYVLFAHCVLAVNLVTPNRQRAAARIARMRQWLFGQRED